MKPSKRTREQAALICAIAASTPLFTSMYFTVTLELGWLSHREALELARAAWDHAYVKARYGTHPAAIDAEAEALLRTGEFP